MYVHYLCVFYVEMLHILKVGVIIELSVEEIIVNSIEVYKKVFGLDIKRTREFFGYSQEYMAEKIGVSKGTYRNLEGGQRIPTTEQIEALSVVFKIDFKTLMQYVFKDWTRYVKSNYPELTESEYAEKMIEVLDKQNSIIEKWEEEKKNISFNIEKKILETIEMYQRLHGGVKVLSEVEKKDLLEQVSLTMDLKIKQVIRRK